MPARAESLCHRVSVAACGPARRRGGLSELLGRASARRGGGARLGATNPGPSRRGRRHDRSRLRRIHRAGAERRRAFKATAPSTPARVRVARARVLLSRPVCSSQLLGRGSPCLRTLGLTILSHPSRNFQSLLKPNRPVVHGCQVCAAPVAGTRVFPACVGLAQNHSRRPPGPPRAADSLRKRSH